LLDADDLSNEDKIEGAITIEFIVFYLFLP